MVSSAQLKAKKVESPKAKKSVLYLPFFSGFIVVVLPLFYMDNVLDFTLVPRMAALGVFMLLFGTVYFYNERNHQAATVLSFSLFPLLGLMAVVTALSLMLCTNPGEGLFDLMRWLLFSVVVFMAVILFKENQRWPVHLAVFSMLSALVATVIGATQYYQEVYLSEQQFLPDGRPMIYKVEGLMSHKNLFSLALFLFVPWIGYGVCYFRGLLKVVSTIILVLTFMMILILQTRAVWLGMLVSMPVTAVLYMIFFRWELIRKHLRWFILAMLIVSASGIVLVYSLASRSQNRYVQHFASMMDPSSYQNVNRLKSWSLTLEMIGDNPFTGVGAGNWQLEAPKYYAGRFSDREQLNWVRPHNDFLWVFAEKGAIGFGLFLAIFATAFYYLLRVLRLGTSAEKKIALVLVTGLSGYLTASVFDFPYERPFHLAMLALYLAGSVTLWTGIRPVAPFTGRKTIFPAAYLITSFVIAVYSLMVLRQENLIRRAVDDAAAQNWHSMLEHATAARSWVKTLDPLANPVETYVGKALEELGDKPGSLESYRKAFDQNPTKLKVIMNVARLLEVNGLFEEALQRLDQGLRIIPFHHQLLKQKSDVYYRMERYQDALDNYKLIMGWERDSLIRQNVRYLDQLIMAKSPPVIQNK